MGNPEEKTQTISRNFYLLLKRYYRNYVFLIIKRN